MGPRDIDDDGFEDAEGIDESMHGVTALRAPVSQERAMRFYDRMRANIHRYLERKGKVAGKTAGFLLLVPDVFMLIWRLVNDRRVSGKNKIMLGSGIAYYLFPFDIIPEGLIGAGGYLDDLVFAVYLLRRVLRDTDPEVLREHWSGNEDVLAMIQKVLDGADRLVGSNLLGKIRKIVR